MRADSPVGALARAALRADAAVATGLNAAVCDSGVRQRVTACAASGLAGVEVVLMLGLACGGGKRAAVRMVAAVGLVYVFSEVLGVLWPRARPFAHTELDVQALVAHSAQRSFPSRHVASGVAMAAIGERAHPRLGAAMRITAWLLGNSRVAAGVHYPSDVLVGAVLGRLIGRLLG
jgi:undecaprenyl-diphosphatase